MSDAYIGGCACGAVRYEIADEPIFMNECQCQHCRKRSGTGHGSYLTFPSQQNVKLSGEAKIWQVAADNGNVKSHAFCPQCGAPVYLTFSATPAFFTIHAGSLDEPSLYRPQAVTFASRAQAWDRVDPALQSFAGMPE
ncbi:GFA family protein [Luteimonas sp. SX5]|uniref:GFA family protein n=1 Tax=Luteimonas galliterrae TaxID=2940486 RepID=A0ABT0MFG1_9GAMM|nr:GFA family protein [Luteimonas galliterrae]MCL1633612.1 GFA family protein [Luteimonas galliterrae]